MSILAQSFLTNENAPYLVIGAGVFIIMYVVIRPFMRRKKDPLDKPPFMRSLSQQRSVERQMETLLVELSEMSRQMSAQLDTRATRLELLLKDADEKIAILKELSAHPPRPFEIDKPLRDEQVQEIAPKAPMLDLDPTHAEIYRLADEGRSVSHISSALNRPSGEVELILALRQR